MDRTTSIVPFLLLLFLIGHLSDSIDIHGHKDIGTDNPIIAGRTRSCQKPDGFDRQVQMMNDCLRTGLRPYVCIREQTSVSCQNKINKRGQFLGSPIMSAY